MTKPLQIFLTTLFFAEALLATQAPTVYPALKSYSVLKNSTTVSGVSSGAFMAMQLQVAHSSEFSGVGLIAGGTYGCSQGTLDQAKICLQNPEKIETTKLIDQVYFYEHEKLIDPAENLVDQKIYIYASPKDAVVSPGNALQIIDFYKSLHADKSILFDHMIESAHGFPTVDYGLACDRPGIPWMQACAFDSAHRILEHLYGPLIARGTQDLTHLHFFSQDEFDANSKNLFASGWIYVPGSCAVGKACRLHMALHGCQMNPEYVQDQFVRHSGFNEWAETNDLIIVYPQAARQSQENPAACWDWMGRTGTLYATQKGPEVQGLMQIIHRIRGEQP